MTDTLLRSLREHMLDESESLAGLLRKCLLLGAETGSESLRDWARKELNGYGEEDEVPSYRILTGVPIMMDSISGNMWSQNQTVNRYQMPTEVREAVPENVWFKQPIEELEQLSALSKLTVTSNSLTLAQIIWNRQLGRFQNIVSLSHVISGSALTGILGQIRTKLVDLVADLTAGTPLSEIPKKDKVDAAVSHRIGDIYNTTIEGSKGSVAIGTSATANTNGLTIDDALRLLDKVQELAAELATAQRDELLEALVELRGAVENDAPDTGDVVKKVGKLRTIANKIGNASVSAAASGAASTLAELAINGAFG